MAALRAYENDPKESEQSSAEARGNFERIPGFQVGTGDVEISTMEEPIQNATGRKSICLNFQGKPAGSYTYYFAARQRLRESYPGRTRTSRRIRSSRFIQ